MEAHYNLQVLPNMYICIHLWFSFSDILFSSVFILFNVNFILSSRKTGPLCSHLLFLFIYFIPLSSMPYLFYIAPLCPHLLFIDLFHISSHLKCFFLYQCHRSMQNCHVKRSWSLNFFPLIALLWFFDFDSLKLHTPKILKIKIRK